MCCSGNRIDGSGLNRQGIIQITCGGISMFFTIGILAIADKVFIYSSGLLATGSGIWAGTLTVIAGLVTLFAGIRQTRCLTIAALVMHVFNFMFAISHLIITIRAVTHERKKWHCYSKYWWQDWHDCVDWFYTVTLVFEGIVFTAAFVMTFSSVFTIVLTSRALHRWRLGKGDENGVNTNSNAGNNYNASIANNINNNSNYNTIDNATNNTNPEASLSSDPYRNTYATSKSLKANAVLQLQVTLVGVLLDIVILFIVNFGVKSAEKDRRYLGEEDTGVNMFLALYFFLIAWFGWMTVRGGQNLNLITFLCLNVFGLFFAPWEIVGGALAIGNPEQMEVQKLVCDERENCHLENASNAGQFMAVLIILNAFLILTGICHFVLCIWGIAAAGIALHRDGTCYRCCAQGNCSCDDCCGSGNSQEQGTNNSQGDTHDRNNQFIVTAGATPGMVTLVPAAGNESAVVTVRADSLPPGATVQPTQMFPQQQMYAQQQMVPQPMMPSPMMPPPPRMGVGAAPMGPSATAPDSPPPYYSSSPHGGEVKY